MTGINRDGKRSEMRLQKWLKFVNFKIIKNLLQIFKNIQPIGELVGGRDIIGLGGLIFYYFFGILVKALKNIDFVYDLANGKNSIVGEKARVCLSFLGNLRRIGIVL